MCDKFCFCRCLHIKTMCMVVKWQISLPSRNLFIILKEHINIILNSRLCYLFTFIVTRHIQDFFVSSDYRLLLLLFISWTAFLHYKKASESDRVYNYGRELPQKRFISTNLRNSFQNIPRKEFCLKMIYSSGFLYSSGIVLIETHLFSRKSLEWPRTTPACTLSRSFVVHFKRLENCAWNGQIERACDTCGYTRLLVALSIIWRVLVWIICLAVTCTTFDLQNILFHLSV